MKRPAFQFYTGDWRKDPCLRMCSPATRGLWVDMLCAIHDMDDDGSITGTVEQLARTVGCFPAEMEAALHELNATKTADVTFGHDRITVVSRRFRREFRERKAANIRKKRERGEDVTPPVTPKSRPPSRESHDTSSSSSSSSDQIPLTPKGGESAPSGVLNLVPLEPPALDFEAVYALYPRKGDEKTRPIEKLRKSVTTPDEYQRLVMAVKNYARQVADEGTAPEYVKRFKTWVNCWRDFVVYTPQPAASARASRAPVLPEKLPPPGAKVVY